MVASRNLFIIDYLWDWFKQNRTELEKLHSTHFESVISNVVSLAGLQNPDEVRTYLEEYVKEKESVKDTVKMTLERLVINTRLRAS